MELRLTSIFLPHTVNKYSSAVELQALTWHAEVGVQCSHDQKKKFQCLKWRYG